MLLGCGIGALGSGFLSDFLAVRFPMHGRIASAQEAYSIMGMMLVIGILKGQDYFNSGRMPIHVFASFMLIFGIFSVVGYIGAVKPILSEIVAPRLVATALGFCSAIDNAIG